MRTTVRIDDDLLRELRERAHRERTSLTVLVNRVIRCGLERSLQGRAGGSRRYREEVFAMGMPRVALDKALALAAALEDGEVVEKMARRK